ncbi:MAG: nucleotidyl transferase AbiEii/AbiGii toxin family protein, partial [Actinobacteria bacterium]|nr:nucleotidyl transferase AbiEii/AbiGii toxin family protein [Actinomycetota bacterium]
MNASKKPTRATPEGNAYLDLQALAKQSGRPVDEYLTLYALEGFLNRLSQSPRREEFVLKGGVLLAAFDQRRPTRDVDFAVIGLDNDVDNILSILREVAAADVNVGDPITPKPEVIALPRILGGTIQILGYPVEMVIAEKLVTAIERGTANTRW